MPQFFISRPIFAWVVALFIILAGVLAIPNLPIAQFPNVAPPSVTIETVYPGASAETVDESVTSLIERELNGAPGLLYFEGQSDSYGRATITATFEPGTDPDLAAVDVQNRIKRVESRLPQSVIQQGLNVEKASSNFLMVVTLSSPDGTVPAADLADYASRNLLEELTRVPGVGKTQLFAAERAMRVWVDPTKLVGYELSLQDVNNAISSQNVQVPAGSIGSQPADEGQQLTASIVVRGMLQSPEEFGAIVLRANPDGSNVYLRDVARVEVGSESYQFASRLNGQPAAAIGIQLATGGNALNTANTVRERLAELQEFFPAGIEWGVPYDTSPFVRASIEKVVHTLLEAIVLVVLVMYLFLQNFRYTLIPTIIVPIALLGTLGVMYVAGFSINVLTMFGMVLAIGILVDDAIVVIENVERIMAEEGLSPRQATRKAMRQITGAIVGITLVLSAVFIPLAFMGGSVGIIYRQFAISMAVSIAFSGFLALSLTPALCATLLKPINPEQHAERKGFFGWFNRVFNRGTQRYKNGVTRLVHRPKRFMLLYLIVVGLLTFFYLRLPSSFLPVEDQGYVVTNIQLPPGATTSRTSAAMKQMEDYYLARPAVDGMVSIMGFSFSGAGENAGLAFTTFKDWSERNTSAMEEGNLATGTFMQTIRDGEFFSLVPPAIPELGNASGFTFRLQDRGNVGRDVLLGARNQMLGMANNNHPVIAYARPEGLEDAPQIHLDIDREAASAQGVPFANIAATVSAALGSSIVNDFSNNGRMQRVIIQADAQERMTPESILKLNVLNAQGQPVPLETVAKVNWTTGPMGMDRYNGYPAFKIAGDAKPGLSTGQAMEAMEAIAAQLPAGIGYEWTGQSLQERISGSQMPLLISLAMLAVFLLLAALYESWSIPLSVVLVVPLGLLGSVLAVTFVGMPNDVFFKVGMVTIIGLSAKNAILIVEFAKDLYAEGHGLLEATIEAARLRFRPILMTSLAFTMGVIPLALASGASAASQQALGIGVLGGMISGTLLAIFFVPVFFVAVLKLFRVKSGKLNHHDDEEDTVAPAPHKEQPHAAH